MKVILLDGVRKSTHCKIKLKMLILFGNKLNKEVDYG